MYCKHWNRLYMFCIRLYNLRGKAWMTPTQTGTKTWFYLHGEFFLSNVRWKTCQVLQLYKWWKYFLIQNHTHTHTLSLVNTPRPHYHRQT